MLDGLTLYVIGQFLCQFLQVLLAILTLDILIYHLDHHFGNMRVDVTGFFPRTQIYLVGSLYVSAQGGIVLQAVATTVLMYMQMRDIILRIGTAEGVRKINDSTDGLPAIFVLQPFPIF